MLYEGRKHDGSLPIIGVNTFLAPEGQEQAGPVELARSTEDEKRRQLDRLAAFKAAHRESRNEALEALRHRALEGGNLFDELMRTVRHATLGEITETLFEVGGSYRRNV